MSGSFGGLHGLDDRFVMDVPGLRGAMSEALIEPDGQVDRERDAWRRPARRAEGYDPGCEVPAVTRLRGPLGEFEDGPQCRGSRPR